MSPSAPARVRERFVAWLWQRQLVRGPLVCDDGRVVQVVFPGRSWGDGQPDFQGALIAWPDGHIEHGDVEIHVTSRDWTQHGHHRDAAYGRVILHVVLNADSGRPTFNMLGQRIPMLALLPYLPRPIERLHLEFECDEALTSVPCQVDPDAVVAMLERAGLQRFGERADRFEGDLSAVSPSELLWQGLARALGYTRNADAMAQLAERVPLGDLRSLLEATRPREAEVAVFGTLLGTAGLLPSQRCLPPLGLFVDSLEQAWRDAQAQGWCVVGRGLPWEIQRVRPGNHPVRRLAAMAVLAVSFRTSDPLHDLARIVLQDDRPSRTLTRYFEVHGPAREWGGLVDLERAVDPPVAGLIGRDRAVEIVINAVLPLLHALGRYWDNRSLEAASLEVYRTFPPATVSRLVRGMAEQIAGDAGLSLASTACRQQGLLQIFRSTCSAHACAVCPAYEGARGQG